MNWTWYGLRPGVSSAQSIWALPFVCNLQADIWALPFVAHNTIIRVPLLYSIFELQAILRQGHLRRSKFPWKLLRLRYPIYVLQLTPSHKFHSIPSTASCFRVLGNFEASALNDPKETLSSARSRWTHIISHRTRVQNLPSIWLYGNLLIELQVIVRHVHQMPHTMTLHTVRSQLPNI